MRSAGRIKLVASLLCGMFAAGGAVWLVGCGSGGDGWQVLGGSGFGVKVVGNGNGAGPGNSGSGGGGGGTAGDDRAQVDPCTESDNRKFLRISMRNDSDTFIHYFLFLVAFVNSDRYPFGAVCPDDVQLYTTFGYETVADGQVTVFGNFCVEGPAMVYFHQAGQFRGAGSGSTGQLGSAIGPAQGSSGTFDARFDASGLSVPVPNVIIFHNSGNGQGSALKVSRSTACSVEVNPFGVDVEAGNAGIIVGMGALGDPPCRQDAFYYVDQDDRIDGSTALGADSGRRVPNEIQGTGCECAGSATPIQQLAPSRVTATTARCNEFLRGGHIEYVFVRNDETPPFPQLLWRVTDATGSTVHDFDPRGMVP
jgi:hypothetical protein